MIGFEMERYHRRDLEKVLDQVEELSSDGKLAQGIELLEKHKRDFESRSDSKLYTQYLAKMANISVLKSNWDDAKSTLKEAKDVLPKKTCDPEWIKMAQEIYLGMGKTAWRQGRYFDAERYITRGLRADNKKDEMKAKLHIEMANVKAEKGELETAILEYTKAINILIPKGISEDLSRAYNNIADTYMQANHYKLAREYADKCIKDGVKLGNRRQEGFGYLTGGEALVKMGDFESASKYQSMAARTFEDSDEDYVLGCVWLLKGSVETGLKEYVSARMAFENARLHLEKTNIPYYLAKLDAEEAELFKKMGNMVRAKEQLQQALKVMREIRSISEIKRIKTNLKEIESAGTSFNPNQ